MQEFHDVEWRSTCILNEDCLQNNYDYFFLSADGCKLVFETLPTQFPRSGHGTPNKRRSNG